MRLLPHQIHVDHADIGHADIDHAEMERSSSGQNGQPSPGHAEPDDDEGMAVPTRGAAVVTAEQGLKHLLLTVDVERLYR